MLDVLMLFLTVAAIFAAIIALVTVNGIQRRLLQTIERLAQNEQALSDAQKALNRHHQQQENQVETVHQLSRELATLRQTVGQYSEDMKSLASGIRQLQSHVDELQDKDPQFKLYARATELAKQGVSLQELIDATGLSRAEAEVLSKLHQSTSS